MKTVPYDASSWVVDFSWLAFAFGYLPHGPQRRVRPSHDPFAALFPGVSFYRDYAIWKARRDEFRAKGTHQVPWWRFLPGTAD